jgi:6-phosphogluconolactonase (cycloisomerase 2 family)
MCRLGTDQIFQFNFDAKAGWLSSATPAVFLKPSVGPRHVILSKDYKFLYVLSELQATVTESRVKPKSEQPTLTSFRQPGHTAYVPPRPSMAFKVCSLTPRVLWRVLMGSMLTRVP